MEEITIVDVAPQKVLGIRKYGKYEKIGQMIGQVCQFATQKGAQIVGSPIFVCHEKGAEEAKKAAAEGNADMEVAVPVAGEIESTDEFKCYELAGGKMAKIVHKGPYEECTPTYEKLFAWLEQQGKQVVGPTREIYLNDPCEVSPEELLTEIYAPVG